MWLDASSCEAIDSPTMTMMKTATSSSVAGVVR
jgi:hypothetical protein